MPHKHHNKFFAALSGVGGLIISIFTLWSPAIAQDQTTFSVGRDPIQAWSAAVDQAKESLFVATLKLSTKEALRPLVAAHKRGVNVRLLLDGKEAEGKKSLAVKAREAGIEVFLWPTDSLDELHAKFTIIDGKTLIAGSFNLSSAASKSNTECTVSTTDSSAVASATKAFEELVGRAQTVNQTH